MIVFDVEADGLLDQATKIHCLSYTDDGNNYHEFDKRKTVMLSIHLRILHFPVAEFVQTYLCSSRQAR